LQRAITAAGETAASRKLLTELELWLLRRRLQGLRVVQYQLRRVPLLARRIDSASTSDAHFMSRTALA
jgi:hypothetical protein